MESMNNFFEDAYNSYFGKDELDVSNPTTLKEKKDINKQTSNSNAPSSDTARLIADSNISDIEQLGELLRKILNAAWGHGWGIITPDLQRGEASDDIKLPQILFDINSREVSEKTAIKPILTDIVTEVVDGKETGDAFNLYRQRFDCIVEFDFYGRTNLEASSLMNKFETLIAAYAGYLKKQGISEIFFLKEMSPKLSLNFLGGVPMRSLMYYVRIERITSIRLSTIHNIDVEVNSGIELNTGDESDPDIYKNSNITFKSQGGNK